LRRTSHRDFRKKWRVVYLKPFRMLRYAPHFIQRNECAPASLFAPGRLKPAFI
jgi:hypothetical protein